jgi:Fe-S-cluster-containing dehydrogenase component
MKAATDGAVRKRPDGIVIIDPVKSKGQKQIVDACPYGAVTWNEEKQIPQAWPFDAHLLDHGWTRTRAEQACPMACSAA